MIAALVLDTGESRRLGRPKHLLPIQGTSRLRRTVDAAMQATCEPVVVVLGAYADRIRRELRGADVEVALNRQWEAGLNGSIVAGMRALERIRSRALAVVLLVCDQPELDSMIVRRVCQSFDGDPRRIVACEYSGTLGVPALFARDWFDELQRLTGDRGAKPLLAAHADRVVRIPWPGGAVDINTADDYAALGSAKK